MHPAQWIRGEKLNNYQMCKVAIHHSSWWFVRNFFSNGRSLLLYLERAAIVENRRTVPPSQSACPLQSFPFPFCSPMMAISLDPKKNARLRCPVRNDLDRTHTFALPNQPCSAPSGFNFQRFVILRFQHRPLVGLLVFVLA